jgi:hypothetical protein
MTEEAKPKTNMRVVGINLAVLLGYTILCAIKKEDDGLILDMILIAIHVIVCVFLAIILRRWVWLLSSAIVLVIGFSTCAGIGNFNI